MELIQELGIKDLEHVVLKAKQPMWLGGKEFLTGEPIIYFDNIQIALLTESTRIISARGGHLNRSRVTWEDREDVTFQFSNGTINQFSLNMLLEANMLKSYTACIPYVEQLEVDEAGKAFLSHTPAADRKRFYKLFAVNNIQHSTLTEQKDNNFSLILPIKEDGREVIFSKEYANCCIVADYYFLPKNGAQIYTMARERKSNLYTLEATFYLKDENDGLLHTGILEMPKVYIMSNINLRMGERADPTVGTFRIVAMPDTLDGTPETVCRITYLDEDVYGI